jgi:rhamnosyltransferase
MINVSIVIPVKNGLKWLKNSIPLIMNQSSIQNIEIIILDSQSTDDLVSYINSLPHFNIKYISINPDEFNHGKTRNLGVYHASYEIIVFTVQDATPISCNWLSSLVEPLINYKLDAICGSQIVLRDYNKNPVEWHRPIERPCLKKITINPREFSKLNSLELKSLTGWDNVNSAYKRSCLLKLPFKEVIFGEDAYWAVDALRNGLKLAYTSYSQVDHYHHYTKSQFVSRYLAEFYLFKDLYNLEPEKQNIKLINLLRWTKTIVKSHRHPKDIYFWLRYNMNSLESYNESIDLFFSMSLQNLKKYISTNQTISTNNSK